MDFKKCDDENIVRLNLEKYLDDILTPIDGMWEMLHYANAENYLIQSSGNEIGFCKINEQSCLFLVYLEPKFQNEMDAVLVELIESKLINSGKLSTAHPLSFNAGLSFSKSVTLDTLLYEHSTRYKYTLEKNRKFLPAGFSDHQFALDFFKEQVNFDDQFGYTDHLISRGELYFLYENDRVVASGECRLSESQSDYADVGMIVHQSERGNGLATLVLNLLNEIAFKKGRKPICSTTVDNKAAQKAIKKAGFVSKHRIYEMTF